MNYPLPVSTVTAAIKSLLVVTDLLVWDVPDLTNTITVRDCPVLFPEMRNGFTTNWHIGFDAPIYGAEGARTYDTTYVLQYSLAFAPIGADRALNTIMPAMHDLIMSIVYAATQCERLGGLLVKFETIDITGTGADIYDPANNQFYGKLFHFQVTEYIG